MAFVLSLPVKPEVVKLYLCILLLMPHCMLCMGLNDVSLLYLVRRGILEIKCFVLLEDQGLPEEVFEIIKKKKKKKEKS